MLASYQPGSSTEPSSAVWSRKVVAAAEPPTAEAAGAAARSSAVAAAAAHQVRRMSVPRGTQGQQREHAADHGARLETRLTGGDRVVKVGERHPAGAGRHEVV